MDGGLDMAMSRFTPNAVRHTLPGRVIGLLLLWSTVWVTVCVAVWAVALFLGAGGFPEANLLILAFAFLGPPLGLVAGGAVVGFAVILIRIRRLALRLSLWVASLAGWSVALMVCIQILSPSYLGLGGVGTSVAITAIGALVSLIIAWPSRRAKASV